MLRATGAQTTTALHTPTTATGLYANWSLTNWDFGTGTQYPVLAIDFNNDGSEADDITLQRLVVMPANGVSTPDAPTGLTADVFSGTQAGIIWTAPTDDGGAAITGYQVRRSTDDTLRL